MSVLRFRLPKVGIRNISPHLRNSAILRTTKRLRNCGPSKFYFRNSATLCSRSGCFKNQPKTIFTSLFQWKPKTCIKGTVARDFWPPIFFHESTPYGFLIHTLNLGYCNLKPNSKIFKSITQGFIWGWFTKKQAKNLVLLSLQNPLNNKKYLVVKIYIISNYSTAKNMPKIAEVKLSSCGLQIKLRLRNSGVAVTEQHFLKSCRIAIVEVLPSSCEIAIADSKKSCACPPLPLQKFVTSVCKEHMEVSFFR